MKGFDSDWLKRHELKGRGGSVKCPPWTDDEDRELMEFYRNYPAGKDFNIVPLMLKLGRSHAAIVCRANALGVSFERGGRPRNTPKQYESAAIFTQRERSAFMAVKASHWHSTHTHPMMGKDVSESTRELISKANRGRRVPQEVIARRMKTRARNGTMAPNSSGRSWKAGWRTVGGTAFYARSRWEANYGRYLEFLKRQGQIISWEHEPVTFWFESIKRGCRSYLPDFRVTFPQGNVEYHEVKGWMDARSKTKIRRMAKYHPTVKLVVRDSEWFRSNQRMLSKLVPEWEVSTR